MNVTIWGVDRAKCVERLYTAYGQVEILEESPIFNKINALIGFRFICAVSK